MIESAGCVDSTRPVRIIPARGNSGENHHARVPVPHTNSPTASPPDIELADGAVVLRGVVRADVDRSSVEPDVAWRAKLREKSRSELPLLDHQTNVRNVLLLSRFQTASDEVVLLHQTHWPEVVRVSRAELLSVEIIHSKRGRDAPESRTQHRELRLRFRFSGECAARARATFARDSGDHFIAGNNRRIRDAPH